MKRRTLIVQFGGLAAAWPLAARAQRALPTVGFLRSTSFDDQPGIVPAFRQGLAAAGFVEGRNVAVELRAAERSPERLQALVAEMVRRPVDVIVGNLAAALAAKAATATVPIVFATGSDPVKDGLVSNFRRPGANVTGVSFLNFTLSGKQIELLHELVPAAKIVGFLGDATVSATRAAVADAQAAAAALGIRVVVATASTDRDIEASFADFVQKGAGAVMIVGGANFSSRRGLFVALAARHALPAVFDGREFVVLGGLMSYGSSIEESYGQAGNYAGRILAGAKPGDLPVVQGTRVILSLNLKTAQAHGWTFAPALVNRADEVIE